MVEAHLVVPCHCCRFRYRFELGAVANGVAGGVASLAAVALVGAAAAAFLPQGGPGGGEAGSTIPRSQASMRFYSMQLPVQMQFGARVHGSYQLSS